MSASTWIKDELHRHHIPFEEVQHNAAYTAQELAQQEHTSGHKVAKLVVVIADGHPHGLILPASRKILLHRVREALGATYVRLASEGELRSFCSDCDVGATPPIPHWPNIKLLMDECMKVPGDILFQAGTHLDGIKVKFDDWFHWVKPDVASFSIGVENLPPRSAYRDDEEADELWF
jgi:Ala-tRNA(Pro) deacylase